MGRKLVKLKKHHPYSFWWLVGMGLVNATVHLVIGIVNSGFFSAIWS